MSDPYLDEYDAYLNGLDRFAAPVRRHSNLPKTNRRSRNSTYTKAIACVFIAIGVIVPWIG